MKTYILTIDGHIADSMHAGHGRDLLALWLRVNRDVARRTGGRVTRT